jgi:hypothetical protein
MPGVRENRGQRARAVRGMVENLTESSHGPRFGDATVVRF